jgi:parallel beta-helix repeat protein
MKRKRLIGISLALTASLMMIGSSPAHAQTVATHVVDDDGRGAPGNCNAATLTHTTIQAGVNAAAPGDIVQVCRGVYTENVVVNTANLHIKGAKAGVNGTRFVTPANESIVRPPVTPPNAPLFMLEANGITLNGFLIEDNTANAGVQTRPTSSGYRILNNIVRQNVMGIYLHGSGDATTLVRRNLIQGNNQPGAAAGNGIYSDQGALGITIQANNFRNHQNGGITFATAMPSVVQESIIIQNNRSLNDNNFVALFDVQNATIVANRTNDDVDGDDFSSTIFIGGDSGGILIQRNVLTNPGFAGIAVRDTLGLPGSAANVQVFGNTVTGAEGSGIDVTASDFAAVSARNNTLRNNGVGAPVPANEPRDGIYFGPATRGNQIRGNSASGNGNLDCEDDSTGSATAGTANTWVNNNGVTDNPNGICP